MEPVRGRWEGALSLGPESTLTLPDMDEVLFRLPGLLDYRATVSKGREGTFRLHVDVHRARAAGPTEREVLEMLDRVDAIRMGIAGSSLEIPTVSFTRDGRWTTTGVSKRKIAATSGPAA
jgi:hypothetical protein